MGILFSISNLVRLPWRLLETWGILKKKRLTGGSEGIAIKPPINNKLKSLITPITLQPKLILIVEDYGLKARISITSKNKGRAISGPALVIH